MNLGVGSFKAQERVVYCFVFVFFSPWLRYKSSSQSHFNVPSPCLIFFFILICDTPGIYSFLASIQFQLFNAYTFLSQTVAARLFPDTRSSILKQGFILSSLEVLSANRAFSSGLGIRLECQGEQKDGKFFKVQFLFCKSWSTDFIIIKRRISSQNLSLSWASSHAFCQAMWPIDKAKPTG